MYFDKKLISCIIIFEKINIFMEMVTCFAVDSVPIFSKIWMGKNGNFKKSCCLDIQTAIK